MKRARVVIVCIVVLLCPRVFCEQIEIERTIQQEKVLPVAQGSEAVSLSYSYDHSWVKQGASKGYWKENSVRLTALTMEAMTPYCEWSRHARLDQTDSVFDVGSYVKTKKGFFHLLAGFNVGSQKYLYRFKSMLEYERTLFKTINANFDVRYLRYVDNDTYILSPGIIYYFGNNYLSCEYGASLIESRDAAHFVSLQSKFSLTKQCAFLLGASVGERLYDIALLPSSEQYGYITFLNFDFAVAAHISLQTGFSYGKEQPSFIKRGVRFAVKIAF